MATPQYAKVGTSGKAVASLILAIVGLFIFPIILSALAVIFGWLAVRDIDRNPALGGRGMAITGIVIGAIGLILGIVAVIMAARYHWFIYS